MLKIAVIGAGSHCRRNHAPALQKFAKDHPGRIELSAVCAVVRSRARRVANEFGFREAYTNHWGMLDHVKPDACAAVTRCEAGNPLNRFRQQVFRVNGRRE